MDPRLTAHALNRWEDLTGRLNAIGDYLPGLALRLTAGLSFLGAGNGLPEDDYLLQTLAYPAPLSWLPTELAWSLQATIMVLSGWLLLLGLCTRIGALSLLLCCVSMLATPNWPHRWPELLPIVGSANGGPVATALLAIMLLPLLFQGPGRLSADYLIGLPLGADPAPRAVADWGAWALAALFLGGAALWLWPVLGMSLLAAAFALAAFQRWVVG